MINIRVTSSIYKVEPYKIISGIYKVKRKEMDSSRIHLLIDEPKFAFRIRSLAADQQYVISDGAYFYFVDNPNKYFECTEKLHITVTKLNHKNFGLMEFFRK